MIPSPANSSRPAQHRAALPGNSVARADLTPGSLRPDATLGRHAAAPTDTSTPEPVVTLAQGKGIDPNFLGFA
jgi:hypothetical protein